MRNLVDRYLLFRLHAHQDPEAFARLYDRYAVAIYRFIYVKVSSKEKAEDLTSETFLHAWDYALKQTEIRDIRALFYQIARRLVIDQYRRDQTHEPGSVTFSSDRASSLEETMSDSLRGQRQIEAQADFSLLMERLSHLKEDYQDVLVLRLVNGLSFAAIGEILAKTAGNVRVIYHRATKALDEE